MNKKEKNIINIEITGQPIPPDRTAYKENELDVFNKHGLLLGRIISGSKSYYCFTLHPDHLVMFNGNVFDADGKKLWHGDLDINIDGQKLKKIAQELNTVLYTTREMHLRWEDNPSLERIKEESEWNTDDD